MLTSHTDLATIQDAETALQYVDAECRDTWVQMAMALKSEFGDAGFDVWDSWSQGGSNYKPGDAKAVWKSVKAGGGITIKTLFKLAMDNGYKPEKKELSPKEKQQFAKQRAARQREVAQQREKDAAQRQQEIKITAEFANDLWRMLPEEGKSQYLQTKKVRAYGLRFVDQPLVIINKDDPFDHELILGGDAVHHFFQTKEENTKFHYHKTGSIVVPMHGANEDLVNLQFISAKGNKKFIKGGRKQGCFGLIGTRTKNAVVVEGYATAATIHMATGMQVFIAFDAGNLLPIAQLVREQGPHRGILICGDDDQNTKDNPGRTKAEAAAEAVRGFAYFPKFGEVA